MKTTEFLDQKHVDYKVYDHDETFDAAHLAAVLRVPGANVAKTVLVSANGDYTYFVIVTPATARVDLHRLSEALGHAYVRLASEIEIAEHCPNCEFGILPPFGSQFGMKTIVDGSLGRHEDLFFAGDTHRQAIRLSYADYFRLERPLVAEIIEATQPIGPTARCD